MKIKILLLSFIVALACAATAFAVPPGKTLVFKQSMMGNVTFSGAFHAKQGLKCSDCHTKVFPFKQTTLTMAAMREGKECGHCHNGKRAFSVKANCTKCHKK